jgi:hypothetical protein
MTLFNEKERHISNRLSKLPLIKKHVKKMYITFSFFLNCKKYKAKTECPIKKINNTDQESFFGYYDKSPINNNGQILFHRTDYRTKRTPSAAHPIELIVANTEYNNVVLFKHKVSAYNWQQGSRAHWLDDEFFIFNDYDSAKNIYLSRLFSIRSLKEEDVFDCPVQDSFKKDFMLSINYSRLHTLSPDYGYRNLPGLSNKDLRLTESDGIWLVNLTSKKQALLYSLHEISALGENNRFSQHALHAINHLMISPTGEKFIFIHRIYYKGRRYDRLILAYTHQKKMTLLNNSGMVSHLSWINKDLICGYMKGPNDENHYWFIDLLSFRFYTLNRVSNVLSHFGDGHLSVFKQWIVVDAYPDKSKMQRLMLINFKKQTITTLGEFFHPLSYTGQTRCDLHPRFSPDGAYVSFDSVFSGKRELYILKVRDFLV